MNLIEAKQLLNNNGYICEFLHKYFPPQTVIDRVKKDLDITLENIKISTYAVKSGHFNFNYSADIKDIKNNILSIKIINDNLLNFKLKPQFLNK